MRPRFIDEPSRPGGGAPSFTALLSRFGGVALDARSGETLLPGDLTSSRRPGTSTRTPGGWGPVTSSRGCPGAA